MKQARGYGIISDPAFSCSTEVDTFTCCHCQLVVDRIPGKGATDDAIGAWCTCCNAPRCLQPWCLKRGCVPIQRWLDQQETRRNYDEAMK